jgi:hypothetical protein
MEGLIGNQLKDACEVVPVPDPVFEPAKYRP